VFPTAVKSALLTDQSADVILRAVLTSCSQQHSAVAEWFKGIGAKADEVRDLDAYVDDQIRHAVTSTRVKSADNAYDKGNYSVALKILRPLAAEGNPIAETRLGQMYFSGDGVAKDFSEAAKWLTLGANQGVDSAQASLGVMYFIGRGVPQDFVLSYMWTSLAAAQGFQAAEDVRNKTASLMTQEQIADAQKRAREWTASHSSTTK
jgi:TPR repeat protein